MKIAANTVAAFEYTLTNAKGDVLDSSNGMPPLEYLHGANNIIPGLERELEGLVAGDEKKVVVEPAAGYGERDERLIAAVPRDRFETDDMIEVGMKFHAQTPEGVRVMTVIAVADDTVTLDGNHPMAGETLYFQVRVAAVREATQEELNHGHPHREGGCCGGHGHGECDGHHHGDGECDGKGSCGHHH
ncbi:MAG: peptidylprolyl isomerase [Puniceicoccales bacterium]|nr:peptidylprolyl isomerase [Puniceicoccales bacterium]